jgi:chromosome segregation ATPase
MVGNFLKILAASVGGGLVLGAGIRLGEAIAAREPGQSAPSAEPAWGAPLGNRIGALETRLQSLEGGLESARPAAVAVRFDAQEAELAAVRAHLKNEQQRVESLGAAAERLRGELRGWLENSVATRMAEVETRLKSDAEHSQRQMLDVFVETVETRVIQRISRLEGEVAGQSAAMSELRECSLRTEQSMQKLLGGLDRIIVPQSATEEIAAAEPLPLAEPRRRSRWSIFG